ncbi:endocuticle structural glycoprotein SgAbd-8-like [Maniola hyperantus]|uniref:endocuticle structural glycoprotein SgAbd-8-like n=1 Tax=Aphantopus hyperantus TaxID=2795564 RepID=UPI00156894F6|nr:endocuticle structural glycoprotein SgAbd-8-like [Maniola hyperantus]
MKVLVVLSAALALTAAVPQRRLSLNPEGGDQQAAEQNYNNYQQQQPEQNIKDFRPRVQIETTTYIPIIHFDKEQANDGSYKTSYETGNNIQAQEEGYLRNVGTGDDIVPALVQQGSYSYTAPDGQVITVEYTADEFGFSVKGDHIPTPPPVSPEIQKGLDLIYAGIRANAERNALELKNNPEAARLQEDKAALDYKGFYHQK